MIVFAQLACNEAKHTSGEADDLYGVYSLDGISPELPYDDLAPLGDLIEGAEVVALGETIHTSGGFYTAKHRMFRYLVEEQGFRTFAIESPWIAADLVSAYIAEGAGSPREALRDGVMPFWASEELLSLVEWMRSWNEENPQDPVSFYGFDIQQPWDDGPGLIAYINEASAALAVDWVPDIERCNGTTFDSSGQYANTPDATDVVPDDHDACLAVLGEIGDHFADNEEALTAATSASALAYADIHRLSLLAWQQQRLHTSLGDYPAAYDARDQGMATVFSHLWSLRHPDTRAVVWAHNWHIAVGTEVMTQSSIQARSMGSFLSEELGAAYAPIALTGYDVSIRWRGVRVGDLPPPTDPDNLEVLLNAEGVGPALVDWQDTNLVAPGESYKMGTEDTAVELLIPAQHFRGLLYLPSSEGMTQLSQ